MVYRVCRCSEPSLPLSAYTDHNAFKLFACDVGLLRQLSQLDPMVCDVLPTLQRVGLPAQDP